MATKKPKGFNEFTPDEYADYQDQLLADQMKKEFAKVEERFKKKDIAKKQKKLTGYTASEFRKGLLEPDKFKKKR